MFFKNDLSCVIGKKTVLKWIHVIQSKSFTLKLTQVINMLFLTLVSTHCAVNRLWEYSALSDIICYCQITPKSRNWYSRIFNFRWSTMKIENTSMQGWNEPTSRRSCSNGRERYNLMHVPIQSRGWPTLTRKLIKSFRFNVPKHYACTFWIALMESFMKLFCFRFLKFFL